MRCPKCQYITFDHGGRCRNCGYEFSLTVDPPALAELPIQDGTEPLGPFSDFTLHDPPGAPDGAAEPPPVPIARTPSTPPPNTGSFELPLFKGRSDVDAPLVAPAAAPRAPLSVRRGAPAPPKPKAGPAPRALRRPQDEPRLALETAEMPVVPERDDALARRVEPIAGSAPPTGARLLAAAIDLAFIGGIDAVVLYLTLRVCDMTFADVRSLPLAPFLAFVLLLDGSYFAAFVAAGGQTIGKMAAGLRVVPGDPAAGVSDRVTLGHAILRAAAYGASALPAGLGFLPGIIGKDRRALHDRLADTRVVKA